MHIQNKKVNSSSTFQVLGRQQYSTKMVVLNQRSNLRGDLGALPAHHEALPHGPIQPSAQFLSLSLSLPANINNTYQSRSSHCGSRASSGGSISTCAREGSVFRGFVVSRLVTVSGRVVVYPRHYVASRQTGSAYVHVPPGATSWAACEISLTSKEGAGWQLWMVEVSACGGGYRRPSRGAGGRVT